jgi:hypothetical protein
LFLVACACEVDAQKADLRLRMAELGSLTDRLRAAIDFAVDSAVIGINDHSIRAHAWMVADGSPDLRQILRDRRTEMVAFARLIIQEAVVRQELPAWIDADSLGSAFITLVDGFVLLAAEAGGIAPEQARREAYSLMELLVAAPMELPGRVIQLRDAAASRVS